MRVARGGHEVDPRLHPCVASALEAQEAAAAAYEAHQAKALEPGHRPDGDYLATTFELDDAQRQAENRLIEVRAMASHCDGAQCLNTIARLAVHQEALAVA